MKPYHLSMHDQIFWADSTPFCVIFCKRTRKLIGIVISTFNSNVNIACYFCRLCPAETDLKPIAIHRQRRSTAFEQVYFYGELIPPYIDKLGRGTLLRPTDYDNTLYQADAKCYRNMQALGSKVNQECIACREIPWFSHAMQID